MKKIIGLILFFIFLGTNAFAIEVSFPWDKNKSKNEVRKFLNKHSKAMDKHDIKTIKTLYDEKYLSKDGFNLDELISMLEKTYSSYGNIRYKIKIKNITISDDTAIAQISDATNAKIYPNNNKKYKSKMGKLEGKSSYIVNLKKIDDTWKIVSDEILEEETSLKYGVARKINMSLNTPSSIENGEDYDLSLTMEKPEDIVALASISREEITYPPKDAIEKFRKFPEDGALERLVKANNKNLDEYAIASVGFTKVSINEEETRAKIEILGMAYILKRVNMETEKGEKSAKRQ